MGFLIFLTSFIGWWKLFFFCVWPKSGTLNKVGCVFWKTVWKLFQVHFHKGTFLNLLGSNWTSACVLSSIWSSFITLGLRCTWIAIFWNWWLKDKTQASILWMWLNILRITFDGVDPRISTKKNGIQLGKSDTGSGVTFDGCLLFIWVPVPAL